MQFRHFFVFVIGSLCLLGSLEVKAQNITTNENGEKIIIYPDGSWKYVDKEMEEALKTKPEPELIEPFPIDTEREEADTNKTEEELEKANKKRRKKAKKTKTKREKTAKRDKKKKAKKPRNKKEKTPKIEYSEAEEAAARRIAARQAEQAATEELRIAGELEEASLNRAILQEELETASTDVEATVDDIIRIEEMLTKAKTREKETKSRLKTAQKRAKKLENMIDMPKAKRDKALAKMEKAKKSAKEEARTATSAKGKSKNKSRKKNNGNWTRSVVNVMLDPPKPECEFTFDGVDEFSGRRRRDLKGRRLFGFTNDRLRPYFKGRDYINCKGYISALTGGIRYLTLTYTIASELAQREFGIIEKGSPITIRFIDGTSTKLFTSKTDVGLLDPLTKTVTYKCTYLIQSASEKLLKKKEVDKIRVVWGTGYEDYEVYELDFFSDQLQCVN